MQKIIATIKRNNYFVIQLGGLIVSFLVLCIFIDRKIDNLLDSDIATQLLLSKHLYDNKTFLSSNWFYSTEIRILSYQIVFTPLFLFTSDLHIIRVAGTIIHYFILLISLYYFCSQFNVKKYFCAIGTIFLLPFSVENFDFMLINVNYIPIMAIAFFSLGLYMHIVKCDCRWKKNSLLILLAVLSLLSGMGGMRQLYLLYAPALMSFLVLIWLLRAELRGATWKKIMEIPHIQGLLVSTWAFIWAFAGYLFNSIYLSKNYYYKTYQNREWVAFSVMDFEDMLDGWLSVLGYTRGNLFSVCALQNGICFILIAAIFIVLYRIVKKNAEYSLGLKFLTYFVISGLICLIIVNNFTSIANSARYSLQILLLCFPILFIYLSELKASGRWKYAVTLILMGGIFLSSVCRYGQYKERDFTEDIKEVAGFLVENEYYGGYATFWNSNVMTELSNEAIETWTLGNIDFSNPVSDMNDMFMDWCQPVERKTSHPEGKIFLLMTKEEAETSMIEKQIEDSYIIYQNATYNVYGFSDYNSLMVLLGTE